MTTKQGQQKPKFVTKTKTATKTTRQYKDQNNNNNNDHPLQPKNDSAGNKKMGQGSQQLQQNKDNYNQPLQPKQRQQWK